ncbi:hypothetical protein [Puniceibacterium confluentis]|uniref:hypothetical protein n=1 Tax=Puniceibacterium confluentis TaxID=1958944 RepID=UPI0011B64DBB|nr:hypothetical protein [Puniceibacterium confluentis]
MTPLALVLCPLPTVLEVSGDWLKRAFLLPAVGSLAILFRPGITPDVGGDAGYDSEEGVGSGDDE